MIICICLWENMFAYYKKNGKIIYKYFKDKYDKS